MKSARRYQSEQELNRWLRRRYRYRGWQHWAVWRVLYWLILMVVFVALVSMCYAYR
jgi:hypothetical protein